MSPLTILALILLPLLIGFGTVLVIAAGPRLLYPRREEENSLRWVLKQNLTFERIRDPNYRGWTTVLVLGFVLLIATVVFAVALGVIG